MYICHSSINANSLCLPLFSSAGELRAAMQGSASHTCLRRGHVVLVALVSQSLLSSAIVACLLSTAHLIQYNTIYGTGTTTLRIDKNNDKCTESTISISSKASVHNNNFTTNIDSNSVISNRLIRMRSQENYSSHFSLAVA